MQTHPSIFGIFALSRTFPNHVGHDLCPAHHQLTITILRHSFIQSIPTSYSDQPRFFPIFLTGVEFDFFELHEMAPENVAMVLIKYLQALPDPIYSAKFEAHFKLALGTSPFYLPLTSAFSFATLHALNNLLRLF